MGRLNSVPEKLRLRPVPENSEEFNENRAQFKKALGTVRKTFGQLWQERQAREEAAASNVREAVKARKAHGDMVRAEKRKAALVGEAYRREERSKASAQSKAESAAAGARQEARLSHLRRRWLKALVKDSQRWVPQERIDEMINPATFSMKYGWHLTGWFEAKERKRAMREEARRRKKPGQPLQEVQVGAEDPAAAYATDWESDDETFSPAAAAADGDASLDSSGRVGAALSVARRAARERGVEFMEPNFDAQGKQLPPYGSDVAVQAASKGQGLSLLNLAMGIPPSSTSSSAPASALTAALQAYEQWLEQSIVANLSAEASDMIAPLLDSEGRSVLDSGVREVEEAYINACVGAGAVEALYYALLRKRARLMREGHEQALEEMMSKWGKWLRTVSSQAGGIFVRDLAAPPAPTPQQSEAAAAHAAEIDSAWASISDILGQMGALKEKQARGAQEQDSGDVIDLAQLQATKAVSKAAQEVPLPPGRGEAGKDGKDKKK